MGHIMSTHSFWPISPSKFSWNALWERSALCSCSYQDFRVNIPPSRITVSHWRYHRIIFHGPLWDLLLCQLWRISRHHMLHVIWQWQFERECCIRDQFFVRYDGRVISPVLKFPYPRILSPSMPAFLRGLNYVSILKWGTGKVFYSLGLSQALSWRSPSKLSIFTARHHNLLGTGPAP